MNRLLICAASLASLSAYAEPKLAAAEEAPKLVVVVVVDQMRRSEIDTLCATFHRRLSPAAQGRGAARRTLRPAEHLHRPRPRADPVGVLRLPERHLSEQVVQSRHRPIREHAL